MVLTIAFYFAFFPAPPILLLAGWHCYQPRSDPGKSADWALLRPLLPVLPACRLAQMPLRPSGWTLGRIVFVRIAVESCHWNTGVNVDLGPPPRLSNRRATMDPFFEETNSGDQRLPHDSGREVDEATLKSLGVLYWRIPLEEGGTGWEEKISECQPGEPSGRAGPLAHEARDGLGREVRGRIRAGRW